MLLTIILSMWHLFEVFCHIQIVETDSEEDCLKNDEEDEVSNKKK
jgi:hypothetical protein